MYCSHDSAEYVQSRMYVGTSVSRGMTKDFCRGWEEGRGARVSDRMDRRIKVNPVGESGEDGRLKTKRPVQPQFELILVNNSPFLEEGISSFPLKFDCLALRYLPLSAGTRFWRESNDQLSPSKYL